MHDGSEWETKAMTGHPPHFVQMLGPVLDALKSKGGNAGRELVYREIEKYPFVSAEDLKATNKQGISILKNRVEWARHFLMKSGYLECNNGGIWRLTTKGRESSLDQKASIELFNDINKRFRTTEGKDADDVAAPSELVLFNNLDDMNCNFWFVSALWDGNDDQAERFFKEGIWQNSLHNKYTDLVEQIRSGDHIAIKSTYIKKHGLPFENQGQNVSCMRIKAIGTVTEAATDRRTIKVDWKCFDQPREWYFYTYVRSIVKVDISQAHARRLIRFVFGDHKQNYYYWLRQPFWRDRYSPSVPDDHLEIPKYGIDEISEDGCFLPKNILDGALRRLRSKLNLILQGPPGTGKTWLAKRLAYSLIGTNNRSVIQNQIRTIQFHPSLSYEDFVRGWRPHGDGSLTLKNGVFLEAVEAAHAQPDRPFVVIIEEINRGLPAQIFGEMLTLLEKDKRNEREAIELAYRQEPDELVYIPHNLYVIGTMNIADRSLALVDVALRRRFAFVTLETVLNESWLMWCTDKFANNGSVLDKVRERITQLNNEIEADRTLGAQFKIGHSYVTPGPDDKINNGNAWFREIVETEIGPLLEEYWFDNPDKVKKLKVQLLQGF